MIVRKSSIKPKTCGRSLISGLIKENLVLPNAPGVLVVGLIVAIVMGNVIWEMVGIKKEGRRPIAPDVMDRAVGCRPIAPDVMGAAVDKGDK